MKNKKLVVINLCILVALILVIVLGKNKVVSKKTSVRPDTIETTTVSEKEEKKKPVKMIKEEEPVVKSFTLEEIIDFWEPLLFQEMEGYETYVNASEAEEEEENVEEVRVEEEMAVTEEVDTEQQQTFTNEEVTEQVNYGNNIFSEQNVHNVNSSGDTNTSSKQNKEPIHKSDSVEKKPDEKPKKQEKPKPESPINVGGESEQTPPIDEEEPFINEDGTLPTPAYPEPGNG